MTVRDVIVRGATERDVPMVLDLLTAAGLPTVGVADLQATGRLLVASDDAGLVACAGVEGNGLQGILRSVAVHHDLRCNGLGRRMVEATLVFAELEGHDELWLCTEHAVGFFDALGFERVHRVDVPRSVRYSAEFSWRGLDGATVMRSSLPAGEA